MNRGTIVEVVGERYKVAIGGNVSAPLPRLRVTRRKEDECDLLVGDVVLVAFLSSGLSDGVVVGRIEQ